MYLDTLVAMNRDHLDARHRSDEAWRSSLLQVVDRLSPSAKQMVAPIGYGASTLAIRAPSSQEMMIDEPMADVIRSKKGDEVGDMQQMELKVDGFIHHNRQLKVRHPDIENKYIIAEVRDPVFEETPNAYTEAAINLAYITVHAKPVLRNGEIIKIYIMSLA